jgi:hypothetical protein
MSWVNIQTANYAVQPDDNNRLVVLNSSSPVAVTLPQPSPLNGIGGTFTFGLANIGSGAVTVSPTASTIDGESSLTLDEFQGIEVWCDGTNYFSVRGTGLGSGAVNASTIAVGDYADAQNLIGSFGEVVDIFGTGTLPLIIWAPSISGAFNSIMPFGSYIPGSPAIQGSDFSALGYVGSIDGSGNVTNGLLVLESSYVADLANVIIDQPGNVGIGGTANSFGGSLSPQNSTLYIPVSGPSKFSTPLQTTGRIKTINIQTSSYTAVAGDEIIEMNSASATTVTLPTSSATTGQTYWIKNKGAGTVTVQAASGNIDGASSVALAQWDKVTVYWDGSLWLTV